jgi:hypothetical protein
MHTTTGLGIIRILLILQLNRTLYALFACLLPLFMSLQLQCLAPESILDRKVCGLGLIVKVLDGSCSFADEHSRHPAGLITESP